MMRRLGSLCLTAAVLTVALGCKSAERGATTPAVKAPEIDCAYVVPPKVLERVCGQKVLRATATYAEGWKALPVCDRKFHVPGGGWVGFVLRYLGDSARARATFEKERAKAQAEAGYQPVVKVGEAAFRFVHHVLRLQRPSLSFRVGPWTAMLYSMRPRGATGTKPICPPDRLARLGQAVAARIARLPGDTRPPATNRNQK